MEVFLLNEILRMQYRQYFKYPEKFIELFHCSKYLAAFDYDCEAQEFLGVSSSLHRFLGYKNPVNLTGDSFIKNKVHQKDKPAYKDYFKINCDKSAMPCDLASRRSIEYMSCRLKHAKGYWKHFMFIGFYCYRYRSLKLCKFGIIGDESNQIQYSLNGGATEFKINKPEGRENGASESSGNGQTTLCVTKREQEILNLISRGLIAKEIAAQLNISETTVISHKKKLLSKFDARNTAELIHLSDKIMLT